MFPAFFAKKKKKKSQLAKKFQPKKYYINKNTNYLAKLAYSPVACLQKRERKTYALGFDVSSRLKARHQCLSCKRK